MALLNTNLKQRILSAAILAPIILLIIWYGGAAFAALIVFATVIMGFEWHDMTVCHAREEDAPHRKGWQLAGMFYITLPCVALLVLRSREDGLLLVLWLLSLVWATDIAAYFAGRIIGGPKLAPSISPNKTWAGLGGGVLAAAATGLVAGIIIGSNHLLLLLIISGLLAVVAQAGDLLESGLKRRFGIKDSGTLIPGHGGLLDRVDGIMTVAPAVLLIVLLVGERLFR